METHEIETLKKHCDEGLSAKEIADKMNFSERDIKKLIKSFGFKEKKNPRNSAGSSDLLDILKKIFSHFTIVQEYAIGEGLCVDFFIREMKLAVEYDGRQHSEYIPHFHGSRATFAHNKGLDQKKNTICSLNGIILVRFNYNEKLTLDGVKDKIFGYIIKREKE